ncbi:hypothetical protein [Neptuniibacter sp. QD37_11]|uniref:hypothetical protein n=1 Tax=Neptuniibacter sp. QD37_11 TaxID=3398209 RepID=UPI0039F4AEC6
MFNFRDYSRSLRLNGYVTNTVKSVVKNKGAVENSEEARNYVPHGMSKDEFIKRYNIGRVQLFVCILFLLITPIFTMLSHGFASAVIGLLVEFITFALYFKYCFHLWMARVIYKDWKNRNSEKNFTHKKFILLALEKPAVFMPIAIRGVCK